jgi:hypothetical protein
MIFGLLQLWFTIGDMFMIKGFKYGYEDILLDGSLLYFCSAIVASVSLDVWFSRKRILEYFGNVSKALAFAYFPMLILITITWLVSSILVTEDSLIVKAFYFRIQTIVLIMSVIYFTAVYIACYALDD